MCPRYSKNKCLKGKDVRESEQILPGILDTIDKGDKVNHRVASIKTFILTLIQKRQAE